jgi:hypothetical protein
MQILVAWNSVGELRVSAVKVQASTAPGERPGGENVKIFTWVWLVPHQIAIARYTSAPRGSDSMQSTSNLLILDIMPLQ